MRMSAAPSQIGHLRDTAAVRSLERSMRSCSSNDALSSMPTTRLPPKMERDLTHVVLYKSIPVSPLVKTERDGGSHGGQQPCLGGSAAPGTRRRLTDVYCGAPRPAEGSASLSFSTGGTA